MIAQVAPAVRLPGKASQTYDYIVPDALAPAVMAGSVVLIPFAGRKISGLVVSLSETATHTKSLKEIYGIAQGLSPLPPYIVPLWTKLSKIFATTLPRFSWTALPTVPSRSAQTLCVENVTPGTARDSNSLDKSTKRVGSDNHLLFTNTQSDSLKIVKEAINKSGEKQTLILVPTVDEVGAWSKIIGNVSVFHSALATGAKYNLACATVSGRVKVVVGTKSAVFLPFSDLGQIVIVSAGSNSHNQEDSDPRFDARIAAMELAKATGADFVALDAFLPLGLLPASNEPKIFLPIIHDLHDAAKRAHSRVLLCEELQNAIDETIANGKRALIILNRRGVSTAYVCTDCGAIIACPNCNISLTIHQDRMSCSACDRLYPLPDNCPICNSLNLKAIGSGSKTLFEALKKRHPATKIVHIDRDAWQSNLDEAQVVVGTTAVFSSLSPSFKPFNLVADALMGAGQIKSGIWSTEATARILRTLGTLLTADGQLHVQTFDTTAPALKGLNDPLNFIKTELEERQAFGYPPSKKFLTIYGAGVSEEALWEDTAVLVALLRSKYPDASIAEPRWSRPKLFRGKYRLIITAKFNHSQNYDNLIQYLPAGFAVGVNML